MSRRPTTAEVNLSNEAVRALHELEDKLAQLGPDARHHPGVRPVHDLLLARYAELRSAYRRYYSYSVDEVPTTAVLNLLEEAVSRARRALTPDVKP